MSTPCGRSFSVTDSEPSAECAAAYKTEQFFRRELT
jgi:hypothetical protein